MTCTNNRLNDGTCICSPCFTGMRCEMNLNVIKFSLTYAIHWDIRLASVYSSFNIQLSLLLCY